MSSFPFSFALFICGASLPCTLARGQCLKPSLIRQEIKSPKVIRRSRHQIHTYLKSYLSLGIAAQFSPCLFDLLQGQD